MAKKKVTKRKVTPTQSKIVIQAGQENIESVDGLQKAKAVFSESSSTSGTLLFKKENYMYILGGIGLMIIGFFLMAGGFNEDPNVFDENVIYSTRRTLIAPIFILAGLVVQVLAIFKK